MILAAHQPDFLPYWGFWAKMALADKFDLAIYDQFKHDYYQHRVKIGTDEKNVWLTLPIEYHHGWPINEVRIKKHLMGLRWNILEAQYRKSHNWEEFGNGLYRIWFAGYELMWQLNFALIIYIRDYLGITIPICVGPPPIGKDTISRLAYVIRAYQVEGYIIGRGVSKSGKPNYLEGQERRLEKLSLSRLLPSLAPLDELRNYSTVSIIAILFDFTKEELRNLKKKFIAARAQWLEEIKPKLCEFF